MTDALALPRMKNRSDEFKTDSLVSVDANVEMQASYDHEKASEYIEGIWPRLFAGRLVPLEIGIRAKMWKVLRAIPGSPSKSDLAEFLTLHCSSAEYLACIASGGSRFGLDGEAAGVVTAQQQIKARNREARSFTLQTTETANGRHKA